MFARQAGVPRAPCGSKGYRLFDGYARPRRRLRAGTARARRPGARRRCRATTTCWPATSSTTGDRMWLIDYEYSGNNDACFELGNTATECDLDDDQVEALVAAYFGDALTRTCWPGCGCRRWCRRTAGRCGARSRPPPAPSTSTSTAWGQRALRQGRARRSPRTALRAPAGGGGRVPTDAARPGPASWSSAAA